MHGQPQPVPAGLEEVAEADFALERALLADDLGAALAAAEVRQQALRLLLGGGRPLGGVQRQWLERLAKRTEAFTEALRGEREQLARRLRELRSGRNGAALYRDNQRAA